MSSSIFTKIKNKEIPGNVIYEDDKCFALEDINPQAPVHILIIPHKEITKVSDSATEDIELLGHLLYISKTIAQKYELEDNYRLIINNGAKAGQSVFHIHIHLMGGRSLEWPPG
jgi:histidine triad (HIT) family protein